MGRKKLDEQSEVISIRIRKSERSIADLLKKKFGLKNDSEAARKAFQLSSILLMDDE